VPVTVSVENRTATMCVDAGNCRLDDLVAAAEDLGYAVTVKSITPRSSAAD
jgi:copper chaperone CopZ